MKLLEFEYEKVWKGRELQKLEFGTVKFEKVEFGTIKFEGIEFQKVKFEINSRARNLSQFGWIKSKRVGFGKKFKE